MQTNSRGNGQLRPLVRYFALTYAFSWILLGTWVYLFHRNEDLALAWWAVLLGLSGAYGPSLVALVATWFEEGGRGVRKLLAKLLIWRVGVWWYAFLVIYPIAILLVSIGIYAIAGNEIGTVRPAQIYLAFLPSVLFALPFGPMAEELGWRGYALPKLQARYGALAGSVVLGLLWTFWHGPLFWFPGAALPADSPINAWTLGAYALNTTMLAILMTWVYNHTRGSVLVAILFHAVSNASGPIIGEVFPDLSREAMAQIEHLSLIPKGILVATIVALFGAKRLTREAATS